MKLFKRSHSSASDMRRLPARREAEKAEALPFQRGRTLTGSASSAVRTLSESQADLKSPRVQAHALTKKRRRLGVAFAASSIASIAAYVLVSQFTAYPVVQASPDTSLRLDAVYAESINGYLSDHIGERWRLFTNTDRLLAHVQQSVPEVKSVKLRGGTGFGKSLFEVTFRKPIASWEVDGKRLYVDEEGTPFSRNYFSPPGLQIADHSGVTALAGQSIVSSRFMSYIGQVIGLAAQQGYTVASIEIPEGMTRQIHVYLQGTSYPFKLSNDRPAGEGVEDMVRSLKWMESRGITPEYVDVRVDGRAFYR